MNSLKVDYALAKQQYTGTEHTLITNAGYTPLYPQSHGNSDQENPDELRFWSSCRFRLILRRIYDFRDSLEVTARVNFDFHGKSRRRISCRSSKHGRYELTRSAAVGWTTFESVIMNSGRRTLLPDGHCGWFVEPLVLDAGQVLKPLASSVCKFTGDGLDRFLGSQGRGHVERVRVAAPDCGQKKFVRPRVVKFNGEQH